MFEELQLHVYHFLIRANNISSCPFIPFDNISPLKDKYNTYKGHEYAIDSLCDSVQRHILNTNRHTLQPCVRRPFDLFRELSSEATEAFDLIRLIRGG